MGEVAEQNIVEGAKSIIDRAVKNKISDIHIEPGANFVAVRYRHGGSLYVANKLPKSSGEQLAAYFKKLAGLDESKTNAPQTGASQIKSGRKLYSLEISTMPVLDGEKITLHIVELEPKLPGLAELGMWGSGLVSVNHALAETSGLILVADQQGGNLGLTINSLLQAVETAKLKTAFIGANSATPAYVDKFVSGGPVPDNRRLTMLDKQGYEIFGVEFFRDKTAAETALEIAASKKMVLAGVVSAGMAAGINSLKYVGQNHLLAANLRLIIGQTFVRRLCGHCREAYEPSLLEQKQLDELFGTVQSAAMKQLHELEKQAAKSAKEETLSTSEKSIRRLWRVKPGGCRYCDNTGHSEAIGIFEICSPGDELRGQIAAGRSAKTLQTIAINDGMVSLRVDGLIKALLGLIDMPTLLSVCLGAG